MKTQLLPFIFCLTFFFTYSQDFTEKYNDYLERYEYFTENGELVGFKEYNNYLEQWEFTKVKNSRTKNGNIYQNVEYYQPDYGLINQALKQKQDRYSSNEVYLNETLSKMGKMLNNKYNGSENKDKAVKFFLNYSGKLVDRLIPDGTKVDLSSSTNTNAIINTYIKALKKTFETIPVRTEEINYRNNSTNKSEQYSKAGGRYYNAGKFKLAIREFKKALIENPDNYSANYFLGYSLLHQEKEIIDEMNSLGSSKEDNVRYDELSKKREDLYKKVLVYLEKTYELNPNVDKDVLKTMAHLYANLGRMEMFKEIKKKLDE